MKKIAPIAAIALLTAFTSCKKDYTCTCTVSNQTIKLPFNKAKKKDAKSACDAAQTTYRNADPNASCSL